VGLFWVIVNILQYNSDYLTILNIPWPTKHLGRGVRYSSTTKLEKTGKLLIGRVEAHPVGWQWLRRATGTF